MRAFPVPSASTACFENVACTRCGSKLAYLPDRMLVSPLKPDGDSVIALAAARKTRATGYAATRRSRRLQLGRAGERQSPYCVACRLNSVIHDLSDLDAGAWIRLEAAKRRLMYTLLALHLPWTRAWTSHRGLAFSS